MATFDQVNVPELMARIELELLQNLTTSLASEDWRSNRARAFKSFQLRNQEIVKSYQINSAIKAELIRTYRAAGYSTRRDLIKMLNQEDRNFTRTGAPRFSVDDKRLRALTIELQGDMRKVTIAARRQVEDVYRKSLAKIQTMLASNLFTLNKSVDIATKDFLSSGINCVQYADGRLVNITSYAEMALRTCNRRVTLHAEGAGRADFGVYTVLVSQYGACSDTCLPYQGKVHFDDVFAGGDPKDNKYQYPLLSVAIAGGLFHPNCRHKTSTWYPGISTIPAAMDPAKVKERSALEEQQRYNERQIRKWKRLRDCSKDPANRERYNRKVEQWQATQRDLINKHPTVLRRDYSREKIYA